MQALRLISDDYGHTLVIGRMRIAAAPPNHPPFPVDAIAREEDTYLLLSAAPTLRVPTGALATDAAVEEMSRFRPLRPGSVVVRPGTPTELLAVVHDVDRDPIWREEWIALAFAGVLREADRAGAGSLALPLLGTEHGGCDQRRVVDLMAEALVRVRTRHLRRMWLVVADGGASAMLARLGHKTRAWHG